MFAIVTDTSANLDCSLLQQRNIAAIPFTFFVGGQEQTCTDTAGFDGPAFYSAMRSGTQVKTSQVSPQQYIDLFSPMLAMGQEILFVGMSSGISGSYHSAEIAAQQLKEVFPDARIRLVDTLSASLGQGLLMYLTARKKLREAPTMDELGDWVEANKLHICHWFTVNDLNYLKKGGRVSAATAFVGTMLSIKPIMHTSDEGKLTVVGKARGRKSSLNTLIDTVGRLGINLQDQVMFICQADCQAEAETVAAQLKQRYGVKEVYINYIGPVIGSHTGPNTMGLFFVGTER